MMGVFVDLHRPATEDVRHIAEPNHGDCPHPLLFARPKANHGIERATRCQPELGGRGEVRRLARRTSRIFF